MYPKYITRLDQIPELQESERKALSAVIDKYAFRTNEYYLSLIDWDDPDDPIRRIIMPDERELHAWGRLDPSDEKSFTKVPGLEHKYEYTALLLVNDVCGGYCRFCFRKRLFMRLEEEVSKDVVKGINYIRIHPEINNVLITGGDPLLLSTVKLGKIISELRKIDHVKIIRIGTKMPAFNPFRIIDDPSLAETIGKWSYPDRKIYIMSHFNHPRELTPEALEAMEIFQKNGMATISQTPIIRGVNDDPEVLGELYNNLSYAGIVPYYIFQCRPTRGNRHLAVPVEEAFEIHEKAKMKCSGLAKRARYVMSHSTGKVEVLGLTADKIIFKMHRAADYSKKARILVYKRNPKAFWFDDYKHLLEEHQTENPFLIAARNGLGKAG